MSAVLRLLIFWQIAVRAKLERERAEEKKAAAIARGELETQKPSALDRFKRPA